MTVTAFGTNSNSTVKLWSERQYYDFVTDTQLLGQLIKAGICRQQMELESDAGDRVRVSFLNRLTEMGLVGMQSASGLENPLVYSTDDLLIDQLRIPVAIPAPYTINFSGLVKQFISEKLVNSGKLLLQKARTILSEALEMGNVQRLVRNHVQASAWKCQLPYMGSDIVCSA